MSVYVIAYMSEDAPTPQRSAIATAERPDPFKNGLITAMRPG